MNGGEFNLRAVTLESMGLRLVEGRLSVLDQTLLPHQEVWHDCRSPAEMIGFIKSLQVRGAPLIGVAAALALGHWAIQNASTESRVAKNSSPVSGMELLVEFERHASELRAARPTAVNLMAAIDRMREIARYGIEARSEFGARRIFETAVAIFREDVELCEKMAREGVEFLKDGDRVLTHCNTGGLATVGRGTALGVISKAHGLGRRIHVYVDETRPLLQGARLTTWELAKLKIPHTLICDNMVGSLMAAGKIDKVFVGADRIARNGDFANKVGTYPLAVLARYHKIPFYVVAPSTTVDLLCGSGRQIPVEERDPGEVRGSLAPIDSAVFNPAFDVTPGQLVTEFIGCRDFLKLEVR